MAQTYASSSCSDSDWELIEDDLPDRVANELLAEDSAEVRDNPFMLPLRAEKLVAAVQTPNANQQLLDAAQMIQDVLQETASKADEDSLLVAVTTNVQAPHESPATTLPPPPEEQLAPQQPTLPPAPAPKSRAAASTRRRTPAPAITPPSPSPAAPAPPTTTPALSSPPLPLITPSQILITRIPLPPPSPSSPSPSPHPAPLLPFLAAHSRTAALQARRLTHLSLHHAHHLAARLQHQGVIFKAAAYWLLTSLLCLDCIWSLLRPKRRSPPPLSPSYASIYIPRRYSAVRL